MGRRSWPRPRRLWFAAVADGEVAQVCTLPFEGLTTQKRTISATIERARPVR